MPSLKEIAGIVTAFVILSVASGHGEWVWKSVAYIRFNAIQDASQSWGCPSIFNHHVCS